MKNNKPKANKCSLWDILGDGDVVAIADLATEHFRRTGRPFRVAIDEAGWRFKNLTDYQVKLIRESRCFSILSQSFVYTG